MTSTLYALKERFFDGYTPLATAPSTSILGSSNPSTNNNSKSAPSKRGASACSDPENVSLHRLRALRTFICGHLPYLSCLFLSVYRITYPQGAWLETGLIAAGLVVLLFLGLIHLIESSFIYAPKVPDRTRFYSELPQANQFPVWRIVRLKAASARGAHTQVLKCLLILQEDPTKRATAPTILFAHGNAGNIGHRLPLAKVLYECCGANVLLLEYRGFGYSKGCPNELGIYADALAAFNYLAAGADGEVDGRNIFLFGRSLGGAVVIDLATRPGVATRVRGTIVENTFCSIASMGHSIGSNILGALAKYCIPTCLVANRFDSLKKLKTRNLDGSGKFIFLSSQKDEIIPPTMMTRLATAWAVSSGQPEGVDSPSWIFDDPKTFITHGSEGLVRFSEGCHGSTWTCDGFNDVVKKFISLHSIKNTHTVSTNRPQP